jgi:GTP-binding protein
VKILRAEHILAAASPRDFPAAAGPEVAFLGRSNVGKSSLLNRLVNRKRLAHTSATPGRTRLVCFYRVERAGPRETWLVDLPGYGFAKVSRRERAGWQALVEAYLGGRDALRVAVLLQDLRRDPGDDERDLLAWLAERGVPTLVAATKADKLKPGQRAARARELARALDLSPERLVVTSATTGLGIPDLWRAIDAHLQGPG